MPAVGYVRSMEMRRGIDERIGYDGSVSRRSSRGCDLTITIEIVGWEGGQPSVMLMINDGTVVASVTGHVAQPPRESAAVVEEAPSSPCLPLPAPRELTRWQLLEVE